MTSDVFECKPTISKLRERVRILRDEDRINLLSRIQKMVIQISNSCGSSETNKSSSRLTTEFIDRVFELYNNGTNIDIVDEIMGKLNLGMLEVVSAVCGHLFRDKSRPTDLTKIIKYLALDEYKAIKLVDMLVEERLPTMDDFFLNLYIVPCDVLLLITLIWAELECPQVARLFEPYLSNPGPENPFSEEGSQKAGGEFNQLLDVYMELCKGNETEERERLEAFNKDVGVAMSIFEMHLSQTKGLLQSVKRLDQIVKEVPDHAYCIETIISDSSEGSDSENKEDDDLYVFTQKTKQWPSWLENELCQANLHEHLAVNAGQFYFAPVCKLFNVDNSTTGYVRCKLLKKGHDGVCEVKCLTIADANELVSSSNVLIHESELAMGDAPPLRCPEGTRVIAYSSRPAPKNHARRVVPKYFSGTIGVKPFSQNRFEYLIFFDDGSEAYVKPVDIRLLIGQPLDEFQKFQPRLAHHKIILMNPTRAGFLRQYLYSYPDWPLIKLKKSENTQRILAIQNGINQSAFVLDVDRQLALLRFPGAQPKMAWPAVQAVSQKNPAKDCVLIECKEHVHNDEWVYRGNPTRFPTLATSTNYLQQTINGDAFIRTLQGAANRLNLRSGRKMGQFEMAHPPNSAAVYKSIQLMQDIRKNQTARKSSKQQQSIEMSTITKRTSVVDKNVLRMKRLSMKVTEERLPVPKWAPINRHNSGNGNENTGSNKGFVCSPDCLMALKSMKSVDRYHSPFLIPLKNGWGRLKIKLECDPRIGRKHFHVKQKIQYRTPCGVRINSIEQVADYLKVTQQQTLSVDMFSFDPSVRPEIRIKLEHVKKADFAEGQEAIPIPMVNAVDELPAPNMIYRPRRTGIKRLVAGSSKSVEERFDPFYCTGCSCTDDCSSESCECRQLTIEAQNRLSESLQVPKSAPKGYYYRRLNDKHISGIYECNTHCKCNKGTCFNRVVQQDIQIPLQLFKTADKGWGVRSLVDIPQGTFICTYAGELVDEEVAEHQGMVNGDIYLADLDLINIVEREKEQQGIDYINDEGYADDESADASKEAGAGTAGLSEDEAFAEPSTSAQMDGPFDDGEEGGEPLSEIDQELRALQIPKERPIQLRKEPKKVQYWNGNRIQEYFGKNFLFVIDAATTGNIGRFLNHSCSPNCQIQHCLVDTHDLRLPWCAFFTTRFIKAGEEITWDYAYEIGVVDKQISCRCGSDNCRGRML